MGQKQEISRIPRQNRNQSMHEVDHGWFRHHSGRGGAGIRGRSLLLTSH
jgi:hypothetical protein